MDLNQSADASSVGTTNLNQGSIDCQWCRANPFWAAVTPSCYYLNDKICDFKSVPQAFTAGGYPAAPPNQTAIDSQSPTQTIDDILLRSQQNAVDAAGAAATQDVKLQYENSFLPGVCVKGSVLYNPVLCFLNDYWILMLLGGVAFLWMQGRR